MDKIIGITRLKIIKQRPWKYVINFNIKLIKNNRNKGVHRNSKTIYNYQYNYRKVSITIIGSSHVSRLSVKRALREFNALNPDVVCLELDASRLNALRKPHKTKFFSSESLYILKRAGFFTWLFWFLASKIQYMLGKSLGVFPGSEMLSLSNLTIKNRKQLALIDQPIHNTLNTLFTGMNIKEKLFMILNLFKLPHVSIKTEKLFKGDLSYKDINQILKWLRKASPRLYNSLIVKRNHYMAINIINLIKKQILIERQTHIDINIKHKKIKYLIIVGLAHLPGLTENLIANIKGMG